MTIPADVAGKQGMTADAAERQGTTADAAGRQGMTADAAGNQETMIPAWREVSILSLHREALAGAKKKNRALTHSIVMENGPAVRTAGLFMHTRIRRKDVSMADRCPWKPKSICSIFYHKGENKATTFRPMPQGDGCSVCKRRGTRRHA